MKYFYKVIFWFLLLLPAVVFSQTFTEVDQPFPIVTNSCAVWGDYDNDGDLDILFTGKGIAGIYRNDTDTFIYISVGLTGLTYSSAAWGDYDNDNDLDILLSGRDPSLVSICEIYRNDGGSVFTNINAGLEGVKYGSVEWGDYNCDGKSDVLICGESASGKITKIYQNIGNDEFADIGADLPGVSDGVATWGDYDNDDDLDIFITGKNISNARYSAIYTNNGQKYSLRCVKD